MRQALFARPFARAPNSWLRSRGFRRNIRLDGSVPAGIWWAMPPPVTLNTSARNGSHPSAGPVARNTAAPGVDPGSEPVRLELAPVFGLGAVDGAWWPRSLDAATELLPLLAALAPQIGRPTRVSLNTTAWDPGRRRVRPAGHGVQWGWFTPMYGAVATAAHEIPPPGSRG